MDPWIRIQSALLAAIVSSALAVNILLRDRKNKLYVLYSVFTFNLVAWYVSDALYVYAGSGPEALLQLRSYVAMLIPVNALRFFRAFVGDRARWTGRLVVLFGVGSMALALLIATNVHRESDLVLDALFGHVFLALYAALFLIYRRFVRIESRIERARLRYLMIGGGIAFTLALLDYLPDIGFFFFGNILTVVFLYFLFHVVLTLRVLDLYEFLARAIVLASFSVVLGGLFLLLVVWWRRELDLFIFNTLVASLVVFILFEPLRSVVEDRLSRFLFRERFEFTRALELLRTRLQSVIDPGALVDIALARLEQSRRVTHAAIYFVEDNGRAFGLRGHLGPAPPQRLDRLQHPPFVRRLAEPRVLVLDALERERRQLDEAGGTRAGRADSPVSIRARELDQVVATMTALHAGVALPILIEDELAGVLAVHDERLREAYSNEEIRGLMAVAAQIATTLQNSRLVARLRERDRLAALGEMAAGLAHEIRNPLGAIKGAAQILDGDVRGGEPVDAEILAVIVDEANRLNSVVSSFLDYARPLKTNPVPTDVNRLVEQTADLLRASDLGGVVLSLQLSPSLPVVQSEPEQLKQVLLNLARNALEAMGATGTLTVRTSVEPDRDETSGEARDMLRIAFQDTGPGVPDSMLPSLFIPFFTTKERGTGLGLAICSRLVKNLGGRVEVASKVGEGATFTVVLPALQAAE